MSSVPALPAPQSTEQALADLLLQVQSLQAEVHRLTHNPAPAPSCSPSPKLQLPEKYDGRRDQFRQFLSAVKLHFAMQPARFASDAPKVGFAAALLKGSAQDWVTPLLEKNHPTLHSWAAFESAFAAMFDDPHRARTAALKLANLRQGRRTVTAYAAEFQRIAIDTDFDDPSQLYWFRQGLSDDILDELMHVQAEVTLQDFIAQCILIDTRLRERLFERDRRDRRRQAIPLLPEYGPRPAGSANPTVPNSSNSNPRAVPMQLDHANISPAPLRRGPLSTAERRHRIENNLCLYCGRDGHRRDNCPLLPGQGNGRAR